MAGRSSGNYGPQFSQLSSELEKAAIHFTSLAGSAAAFSKSIGAFRELEKQLVNTNAAAGGTVEQLEKMELAVRRFALASKASSAEAAQALYFLASAGFTAEQAMSAMTGVILLSQATMTDVSATADTLASTISAFGLQATESTRVANLFAAATSFSQASMDKLAYALRQVGPVARIAGLGIDDTTTSLSLLFNAGLRGEQAGTSLRNILVRLANPVGEVSDIFRELQISTVAADGGMEDLFVTLSKIKDANLSESTLATIFGTEALAGGLVLIDQLGSGFDNLKNKIVGTQKAFEIAQQQLNTLDGSLKLAQNSLNEFGVEIGKALTPFIKQISVELLQLTQTFNSLDTQSKQYVAVLGSLTLAFVVMTPIILGVVGLFGRLFGAVFAFKSLLQAGKLFASIETLGIAILSVLSPIGLLVTALTGLAVYFGASYISNAADNWVKSLTGAFNTGSLKPVQDFAATLRQELNTIDGVFSKEGVGPADALGARASTRSSIDLAIKQQKESFESQKEYIKQIEAQAAFFKTVDASELFAIVNGGGLFDKLSGAAPDASAITNSFLVAITTNKKTVEFLSTQTKDYKKYLLNLLEANKGEFEDLAKEIIAGGGSGRDVKVALFARLDEITANAEGDLGGLRTYLSKHESQITQLEALTKQNEAAVARDASAYLQFLGDTEKSFGVIFGKDFASLDTAKEKQAAITLKTAATELLSNDLVFIESLKILLKRGIAREEINKLIIDRIKSPAGGATSLVNKIPALAEFVASTADTIKQGYYLGKKQLKDKLETIIKLSKSDASGIVTTAIEALNILNIKEFKNSVVYTEKVNAQINDIKAFTTEVAAAEATLLGNFNAQRAADLEIALTRIKDSQKARKEKFAKDFADTNLLTELSGNRQEVIKALSGQAFKGVDGKIVDPNNLTLDQYQKELAKFMNDLVAASEEANGPAVAARIRRAFEFLPEQYKTFVPTMFKEIANVQETELRKSQTKTREYSEALSRSLVDAQIQALETQVVDSRLAGKAFEAFDQQNQVILAQADAAKDRLLSDLVKERRSAGEGGSETDIAKKVKESEVYSLKLFTIEQTRNNNLRQIVIDRASLSQDFSAATIDLINATDISRLEAALSGFETFAPSQIDKIYDTKLAIAKAQNKAKLAALDAEFASASLDPAKSSTLDALFTKLVAEGDLARAELQAQYKRLNTERAVALAEALSQFESYASSLQTTLSGINNDIAKVFSSGSIVRATQLQNEELANIQTKFINGQIEAKKRAADIKSKLDANDPGLAKIESNLEKELDLLDKRYAKEMEFTQGSVALYEFRKKAAEEEIAVYERQGRAANSFFDGFTNAARKSIVEAGDLFYEFGENVFKSLGDQIASSFFGVTQSWRETLSTMAKDFVRSGLGSLIQQAFAGVVNNVGSSIGKAGADGGKSGTGGSGVLGASNGILDVLKGGFKGLTSSFFEAGSSLAKSIDGIGNLFGIGGGAIQGPLQPGAASLGSTGLSASFTAANALGGIGGNLLASAIFGSKGIGADIGGALGGLAGGAIAGASTAAIATSLGSFAGPLGALAGAFVGTAIGGLFGNNKPSDKTQAGAALLGTGQITFDKGLTGKKFSQENKDFKDLVIQYGSGLVQELIKETGTFINQQLIVEIGNRDGLRYQLGGESKKIFQTSSALLESLTKDITRVFTSLGNASQPLIDLNTALPNIDFKDASKAVQDVLFALNYSNLTEKETKKITEAEAALKAIADRFVEVRATAERLGLSLQILNDAQAAAEKALREGFSKSVQEGYLQAADPIGLAIAQQLDKYKIQLAEAAALGVDTTLIDLTHHITIMNLLEQRNQKEVKLREEEIKLLEEAAKVELENLKEKAKAEIDSYKATADAASKLVDTYKALSKSLADAVDQLRIGTNSNFSLSQKLAEARNIFNNTSTLASLGNEDALKELPALGNQLLELSKEFNASGQGFSDDFKLVEQALVNAKNVADRQVSIQQQQLDAANRTIIVLQAGFEKLAARTVTGGTPSVGSSLFNFNDKVVELFGAGLVNATPALVAQLNTIFNTASPGIVAGEGRRTAFFAGDNTANQTAIALARAYGIPGFAKGGITPRGSFLIGENGPEIMSMNTASSVRPIELGGEGLVDEVKILRMQALDGNIEVVNAINNLNDNISQLNKKLDRAIR